MEYREGLIKNTEFFTTSELAKKLKMNVQVITRKVQSGEITAYKIGKDWRIPELSVFEWLEQNSNNNGHHEHRKDSMKSYKSVRREKRTTRRYLLEYILAQFEPNKSYSAEEIKQIIARYNEDYSSILRELVSEKMLERVNGGYSRCLNYRLSG
ncbi:MAG: DUF2087 domain-containing protein [candidate division Zixibacteria bacterium]|nr:DUF2087 domain-containing protein [candidate division Zixibacteria bacterium]